MKAYLFFVRQYNDWDHICPIIWFILGYKTSERPKICVIFYRDDLRRTESYIYLEKMLGDSFDSFFEVRKEGLFSLVRSIVNRIGIRLRISAPSSVYVYSSEKQINSYLQSLGLSKYNKIIVVFDRTINPVTKYVRKALQGFPSVFVSVPHGPNTNVNRLCYTNDFHYSRPSNQSTEFLKFYDFVLFSDAVEGRINGDANEDNFQSLTSSNFGSEVVLGSLRYSEEWLCQVDLYSTPLLVRGRSRVRVVFFMKKYQHNVFVDEVLRTIQVFAMYSDIDFYIKPHTRGRAERELVRRASQHENIHISEKHSSSSLIRSADLILFFGGTSIILEALVRGKPVACIDYLDCNTNVYELYRACPILRSRDELISLLCDFQSGNLPQGCYHQIIDDMVFAGTRSTPISERYVKFFQSL